MAFKSPRESLIEEVQLRLGFGIIDLELDPQHYGFAVDSAIGRYRQRSGNSIEESFVFIDVQPDQNVYTLPNEVQEVRSVYRSGLGGISGGTSIDPFSLASANNIYSLVNPGGLGGGGVGTLATYDFAQQYQSLVGRMFGRDVQYNFDTVSKRLTLHRKFTYQENIALHVFNARPESVIINDVYARPWVRDWACGVCKSIMGEARSKFSTINGPGGGVSLNGESLKTEANADFERLDKELTDLIDQSSGWPMLLG